MTMTPWNFPQGQWSNKFDHVATDTLEFAPWSMVKMDNLSSILLSNFRLTILTTRTLDFDKGHGQNLDYLTTDILKFRP